MALSDFRRKISSAFPTIKVEDSFDKIFKDRKLRNLVIAYFSATDSALEFYESAETFLGKAKDDERIVEKALRGFGQDGSVSSLAKALDQLRISSDDLMEEFARKSNDCRKHISNLERLINSSPSSIRSRLSSLLLFHMKAIPALHRRHDMLDLVEGDAHSFVFCSEMIVALIPMIGLTKNRINARIGFGQVEKLEGDVEILKTKIQTLQKLTKDLGDIAGNGRVRVHHKILEFIHTCVV